MTRYVLSPLAEQDIESIGDYIAQDNPRQALTFIAELRSQCAKLPLRPKPAVPDPNWVKTFGRSLTEIM